MKLTIEKEEYMNKTFKIEKKVLTEMSKICKDKGISLNKFMSLGLQYALENLEKDDDK